MLRNILIAAALSAAAVLPARAQSADEAALLQTANDRGRLIYAYDQAAWHGTDDMVEKVKNPETLVGGWIVDGPAAAPTLIFFDKDAADPHAVYVAQFRDNKLVSSRVLGEGDDRSLSPERKRLIAARAAGMDAWRTDPGAYACSDKSPNTVVLPPAAPGDPILVYILSPQTEHGVIPFGGHFRVEVGADGKTSGFRKFTNNCIALPLSQDGKKPEGLMITHLLDPVPTEIHVFSSYAAGMPIHVGTGKDRMWRVDATGIRAVTR